MNKVQGKQTAYAPIKDDGTRIIIRYAQQPVEGTNDATWLEVYLNKKQHNALTLQDVKAAIIADINDRTREAIIGGFVWEGKPVWLSEENQLNFSTAQAPVTLKIGEQEDGTPVYHHFATAKALTDFWQTCVAWKHQCLTDGWTEKDAIDWAPYEALFPKSEGVSE